MYNRAESVFFVVCFFFICWFYFAFSTVRGPRRLMFVQVFVRDACLCACGLCVCVCILI